MQLLWPQIPTTYNASELDTVSPVAFAISVVVEQSLVVNRSNLCTMVDSEQIKDENPDLYPKKKEGWEDYAHTKAVKIGSERLDRRSLHPDKKEVKKHGRGGKFTIDGPYTEADYVDDGAAALAPEEDRGDPNYEDPSDEGEQGVPVAETVAKVASVGVAKIEVVNADIPPPTKSS